MPPQTVWFNIFISFSIGFRVCVCVVSWAERSRRVAVPCMPAGHPHYQLSHNPFRYPPPSIHPNPLKNPSLSDHVSDVINIFITSPSTARRPPGGEVRQRCFYWIFFAAFAAASCWVINMITLMAFYFYCLSSNVTIDHFSRARVSMHALISPYRVVNYPRL